MVDTHAHLGLCEPAEAELIASARDAGVTRILTVGLGEDSNPDAVASAQANEGVFASVGRHPNSADRLRRGRGGGDRGALRGSPASSPWGRRASTSTATAPTPTISAGPSPPRSRSRRPPARRSSSTCATARASEDAVSEAFDTLEREADGVGVILHCFSAGPRWAERAAEHGWYCSFAGNLTYPKAEPIREAAAIVPEDRLLVETDSPFLAPQPVRGKPNQPANVVATAERLAEVRGVPYGELERTVEANAARVFGW